MDKSYQEIINEKEFVFESLWSSVGGFIGIFVGASVAQLPTIIMDRWKLLRSLKQK